MKLTLKTKKILSLVAVMAVCALPLVAGAQFDAERGAGDANLQTTSVYTIVTTIMNWLLLMLTIVAVIGFIVSGFMYILGQDKEKAKGWLTGSIIGIVVALVGYIALNLISTLLGGNVQN